MDVLLVDDNPDDREIVKRTLQRKFKESLAFDAAASAEEAYSKLAQRGYDVILLDYRLGPVSGLDVLSELPTRLINVPVIFLTGQGSEDVAVEALKRGAHDYFTKDQIGSDRVAQSILNVTKRKHAEDELRRMREFFENVAYSIKSAIAVVDREGTILTWNQQAEVLWGVPASQALGRNIGEIELTGRLSSIKETMMRAVSSGAVMRDTDIELKRGGLPSTFIDIAYSPLTDKTDNILGAVAFAYDVTERNIARTQLLKVDEMKTEFLSITTHELKTPLTPIKIQVEMWMNGVFGEISEKQRKSLEIMHRNCIREINLINDIMTISKLDQEKLEFNIRPIDMMELISNVQTDMAGEASNNGLWLKIDVQEGIPNVSADPNRIMQVMVDLINNALKFTKEGGVTIKCGKSDGEVTVSISDTGIGIPEEEQDRIFERFYQVEHSITRKYRGSGLGLSIVKSIIEKHGGRVWMDSVVGQGTTFYFTLPIANREE